MEYNIEDCNNISDVCRKYIGEPTGGNRRKTKRLMQNWGINVEEWLENKKTIKKEQESIGIDEIKSRYESIPEKAIEIWILRDKGLSYRQISEQLGYSKSTISYWCDPTQREKYHKRKIEYGWKISLWNRISSFQTREFNNNKQERFTDWKECLQNRIKYFRFRSNIKMSNWTAEDLIAKFGLTPKCALTGRQLNLEDPDSYALDHIIPVSRGGSNDLDNLQIVCPMANMCKTSMTMDELFDMCKDILTYNNIQL